MSFFNLRIRGRLYGGFGALLLFCVGLAAFGVWQLGEIRTQVAAMTLQSNNTIRVGEIATELQAVRRAVLRYAFDHDEKSYAEAETRLKKSGELLADAVKTTKSEERRAAYNEIEKNIEELKAKRLALGAAVKQAAAGRDLLFTDGDKMAADVQKFVEAADKTPFAQAANSLEAKVLLVRVANWRMLATRNSNGLETFKANTAKAQQEIAGMEKSDLPPDIAKLLANVKTGVGKYAEAFDKAGPNLLLGDELYYKAITPLTVGAVEKLDGVKDTIGKAFAKTTAETEERINGTVTLQEVVAGAATLLGLLIAFLIARGIIGPLSGLTSGMEELAGGNFAVVLPGLDRKDEVGDMAQAVETFKVKAEEKARDEAEAKIQQDQVAARQRKADMIKLADDFEGAVGEIVETVSSASTELEASAGTLTSTAERSQELTTMVAAASEEASTNVQSVASATEEMSSSVNEISRQVQESARMANEAVGPGAHHQRPGQRIVEGGEPHRRRRRTDQHDRRTDQSAGAQRHHRGGAGRRGRPRLCGGGLRGEGAGRADLQGDRRDRPADHRHPGRDPGLGERDQGDQRHHRAAVGDRFDHRSRGGRAGCCDPGNLPQRAAGRRRAPSRCPPTSPTCSAAPARPDRPPRRCCLRRSRCPATATASSSRSASS